MARLAPVPFLEAIESLKALKHSSRELHSVPEPDSLSEHVYQMALVCLAHPELSGEDEIHAIIMCLVHDVGNIASGQVTLVFPGGRRYSKGEEQLGLTYLTCLLKETCPLLAQRLSGALLEYQAGETRVAQLVCQIDKFESLHQAATRRRKNKPTLNNRDIQALSQKVTDPWLTKQAEQILSDDWDPLEEVIEPRAPIVFVIGQSDVTKRAQLEKVACELNFEVISVDDLLREEQNRPGSIFGDFLKDSRDKSVMVPPSLTTMLLKRKAKEIWSSGKGILIAGFPQSVGQAVAFEREISNEYFTIFLERGVEQMMMDWVIVQEASQLSAESDGGTHQVAGREKRPLMDYMSKNPFRKIDAHESDEQLRNSVQGILREVAQQQRIQRGAASRTGDT